MFVSARISAPLALLSVSALAACGTEALPATDAASNAREQAIINGASCSETDYPATVAILVSAGLRFGPSATFDVNSVLCTGTLIAPDTVLAAAHCVDALVLESGLTGGYGEITRLEVAVAFDADLTRFADPDLSAPTPPLPADAIKVVAVAGHEGFDIMELSAVDGPGRYDDVALLFLERPVTGITPEILITAEEATQVQSRAIVDIVGWGQQTVTGFSEAPPPGSVGRKVCARTRINALGDTEMQIGGSRASARKCHGDSGGPSFLTVAGNTANRARRVVGITSHAYDAEDCAKGGVDTRVDAYLDWIDARMRQGCARGVRSWCEAEGILPPTFFDDAEG